jgi:hypothetical protein
MRTEDLVTGPGTAGLGTLSAALSERTAPGWRVVDARDRPVALSLAGHVLHFGGTYQLWVDPLPDGATAAEVLVTNRPVWLVEGNGPHVLTQPGQQGICVRFHVQRQVSWLWCWQWLREIHCQDVELHVAAATPLGPQRHTLSCPLVARSRWWVGLILLAIFGAALFGLGEVVIRQLAQWMSALVTAGTAPDGLQFSWFWPTLGAVISPAWAYVLTLVHLKTRSRELRRRFRLRWPTAGG